MAIYFLRYNFLLLVENSSTLLPFLIYAGLVLLIATALIVISYIMGERHKEMHTDEPFESGIKPTDTARLKFSSHFYLIAMFFVIFDLDAAFIVSWAITYRELGWAGYIGVSIFILILVAVFAYEWGIGALNFGPDGKKILKAMHKKTTK